MLQFLPTPICGRLCLKADQMIVTYVSLAPQSRSTDLIQHVARLGFCTYILGYLWTALFKSGSNLQRVQHVAGSCVTSAGQCCTYLYLSVPSPPSVPVLIRTTRTTSCITYLYRHFSSVPICTYTALSFPIIIRTSLSVPSSLFESGSTGLIKHVATRH